MKIALVSGVLALTLVSQAQANAYREKAKPALIGDALTVTPPRDWNRLDIKPGKHAETWTLDGEQLNDVTFYTGIEPGEPLVRERNRKREPLPKFTSATLLAEVPELLEGTYRAYKHTGAFALTSSRPESFLGRPGVHFTYDYTDADLLPRKGEARAALINGKLYMATFDAPRLHFFDETVDDYRALVATATLPGG
ncbi:hypothetical protein NS277_04705 [Novosphingobium barchaimii]|nr:hypothetical protein NS277_04705 [Novosphingobium barchaimii]